MQFHVNKQNSDMSLSEKLVSEFMNLGNVTAKDAHVALQVYLELCEVKKYWDVECKYHDDLKLLYITAKRSKSASASIFVPRCSSDNLSFNGMQNYFVLCGDSDRKSVFLVFVSADSTCVYYQISEGLHKPFETSTKHSRLNKQEALDAEIRKHKNVLSEAALCGTSVTIRESKS